MHPKQGLFLQSQSRITAYIGGIRSGKTYAGSIRALIESSRPNILGLVLGPTFPQLRDSTFRTFREVAGDWLTDWHKTEMLATLWNGAQIIFRSADNPDSTRGITASWAWLDEARDMPESAYLVALGRLSEGGRSGPLFITSTPNGIDHWLYTKFVTEAQSHPDRRLITSSIYENIYLDPDFIAALASEYVGEYARQELEAAFTTLSGTLFKREWFIDQLDVIPICEQWVRYWDLATSIKQKADYTVGALVGRASSGHIIIADIVRAQLEGPDVEDLIVSTALTDGPDVTIGIETVAMQLSQFQTLSRRKELLGHTLLAHTPDRGKYQRAMGWASKAKAGVVKLARRYWTQPLLAELLSFTGEENSKLKDDQVDAISGGVDIIASGAGVGVYLGDD